MPPLLSDTAPAPLARIAQPAGSSAPQTLALALALTLALALALVLALA